MICEEKARLTALYKAATTKFSKAATELRQKMGTVPREEYDRMIRAANDDRAHEHAR